VLTGFPSRRVTEDSILAVQVFDQKKFKKKDQGFLGVINVRVGDVVDFASGEDGRTASLYLNTIALTARNRNAHTRSEKIKRQSCRTRKADHKPIYQPLYSAAECDGCRILKQAFSSYTKYVQCLRVSRIKAIFRTFYTNGHCLGTRPDAWESSCCGQCWRPHAYWPA
jgi:hypothetical protein